MATCYEEAFWMCAFIIRYSLGINFQICLPSPNQFKLHCIVTYEANSIVVAVFLNYNTLFCYTTNV